MIGLVGAIDGEAEVIGLDFREGRELHSDLRQMGAGDLLVELLRQDVHAEGELLRGCPERDLGKDLVRERAGHDEGRVARRAAEVDETAGCEEDDMTTIRHGEAVDLRLDVHTLLCILGQPSNVDLNIEMADAEGRYSMSPKVLSIIAVNILTCKRSHLQA